MIEVSDRLGFKLKASIGHKIKDFTVFNKGTYWIHGPTLEKIEEVIGESLELTKEALKLYKQMCTVKVFKRKDLYRRIRGL